MHKFYLSTEDNAEILQLYIEKKLNIMEIAEKRPELRPWKIVSVLMNNNIIKNRVDANGYNLYKKTEEYTQKIIEQK